MMKAGPLHAENRSRVVPGREKRLLAVLGDLRFKLQEMFLVDRLFPVFVAVGTSLVIGLAVYRFSWIFAAGLIAAVAYAVICLRYPILLLMLLILITPFQSMLPASLNFGGGLNLFNILLFTLIGIWFVHGILHRSFHIKNHPFIGVIFLFTLMITFSFIRASVQIPDYTVMTGVNWAKRWLLPMFVFFPIVFSRMERRDLEKLLWVFAATVLLMALVSLNDYRQASLSSFSWELRPGGPFGKGAANDLAAFFVYYPAVLLGWLFFEKRLLARLFLLGTLAVSSLILLLTYSRGGYLGFVLAITVVVLLRKPSLLIVLLVLGISYRVWVPSGVEQRVEMTSQHLVEENAKKEIVLPPNSFELRFEKSTAERLIIWRGALKMIAEKPVFGFGFMTFQRYITRYAQLAKPMDAHNMYLRVAVEMGLVGLAVFLLNWIVPLLLSWKLYRSAADPLFRGVALGMVAAVFGIFVVNLWGSRFFREELVGLYWVLVGILARMQDLERKEQTA